MRKARLSSCRRIAAALTAVGREHSQAAGTAALRDEESVKIRADRVGELRLEAPDGQLVRALPRSADEPHEPVDRRPLHPLTAQQLADPRQQQ
jgi:hypothetical protein